MPPSDASVRRAERLSQLPMIQAGGRSGSNYSAIRSIKEILAHGELLNLLVKRELKARYKDSSLGFLWSLLRPLVQFLVYFFAIGQILGLARSIPSFAIFVFVGLSVWTLFTEIVSNGTQSITGNSGLIKKIYVPREIYPLASIGGALFNYLVQLIILVAAMVATGAVPFDVDVLYAPLSLVVIIVYATAAALVLSALNVYLRDVQHLVEVSLIVLFWASPIVYAFHFVYTKTAGTILEVIYLCNPVTLGVLGMQKALWVAGNKQTGVHNYPDNLGLYLTIALLVGIGLLWIAHRVFTRLQANFAQEL